MNNCIFDYALSYAEKGWYILPLHSIVNEKCTCRRQCRSPGKHPRINKWQSKASTEKSAIQNWWKRWPTANIGLVTGKQSGLVVIDIDPRNGGDKSLQNLIDSYDGFKPVLATYEVKTGGNGTHYYYAYDKPFKSFKKHGLGEGIDIKADGGYVLAAPSNHFSGSLYSIVNDSNLLELPTILIDFITQNQAPVKTERIAEGNRNNWLSEQAGKLLRQGKTSKQVETYLLEENAIHCQPPLEHAEVLIIARSMSSGFKPEASQKSFKTQWQQAIIESGFGAGFSHVCISLSLWMDAEGRNCWPTEEAIAGRCHSTRKTVIEHLKTAEKYGFLTRYKHSTKGKRGFNYGYAAKLPP